MPRWILLSGTLLLALCMGAVAQAGNPESPGQPASVVIYGQPTCKYSVAARKAYPDHTYHDVTQDDAALVEMLKLAKGKAVTPVIVRDGQVEVGFEGKT